MFRSHSKANRSRFPAHYQPVRADVERDPRETSEGQVKQKALNIELCITMSVSVGVCRKQMKPFTIRKAAAPGRGQTQTEG